jgi:hypothetical protein
MAMEVLATLLRKSIMLVVGLLVICQLMTVHAAPDDKPAAEKSAAVVPAEVTNSEKRLSTEFAEIEKLIARLAQSYAKTDPKKAQALKEAFSFSKQQGITPQFAEMIKLLTDENYSGALKTQNQLTSDLNRLMELLQSGDQAKSREDERERLKKYLAQINSAIKKQEEIKAITQGGGDASELSKSQNKLAEKIKALSDEIARNENKSGDNKSGDNQNGKNENGKNDNGKNQSGDNNSGDSKSGDNKSGDSKSGDSKSGDNKSGDNKSGNKESGKNESGKNESGDNKSGDSKSGDSKSGDSKSGDSKSGDNKSGNKESGKNESGKSESGDSKSGDSKSGDSKSGDSKSGDSKSGKSESGNKESGKSESGKSESGNSKSGDSKSGDSKSGDSKSGDSKSGNSESGKSESGNSESGDMDSEGGKSGDSKSGDSKSGDSKSGDSITRRGDDNGGEMPPSEDPPQSSDDTPAKKRLKAAEEKMREAKIKLENAKRTQSLPDQEQALKDLKAAKEEIEQILRQMREEEIEQMLAQLEARFRKMLEMQVQVHKATIGMENTPDEERGRDFEVQASKLSQREKTIVDECDKAIILLKEEGSAVAFTESAELIRDDMQQIVKRLGQVNTGVVTQDLEIDVINALQDMIGALQKAQKELKASSGGGGGGGGGGQPEDQPLVDKIAELKMIRYMQERILSRTTRYSKLLGGVEIEQAEKPELIQAIQSLGERQDRLQEVTRDIVLGKNQ